MKNTLITIIAGCLLLCSSNQIVCAHAMPGINSISSINSATQSRLGLRTSNFWLQFATADALTKYFADNTTVKFISDTPYGIVTRPAAPTDMSYMTGAAAKVAAKHSALITR